MSEYVIVIEKSKRYYWAYVPDLPGCVSAGKTVAEVKRKIQEAIEFHLEGMREDGETIRKPSSLVTTVAVNTPRRNTRVSVHRGM